MLRRPAQIWLLPCRLTKGLDDVELHMRVVGEAIKSEIRVALRIVLGRVVHNTAERLSVVGTMMEQPEQNAQVLAPWISLATHKVSTSSQNPV